MEGICYLMSGQKVKVINKSRGGGGFYVVSVFENKQAIIISTKKYWVEEVFDTPPRKRDDRHSSVILGDIERRIGLLEKRVDILESKKVLL